MPAENSPEAGAEKRRSRKDDPMTAPAAPPPVTTHPRVGMNTRIRADRDEALRRYTAENHTTRQAVIDQMVDEYLAARGYLPGNPS